MNNFDEKLYQEYENKQELVKAETQLVDYTIDNLLMDVEQKRNDICMQIEDFIERYLTIDSYGNEKLDVKGSKSLVISEYFFKPLVPSMGVEPKYNAEKMAIVFDIYRELVSRINTEICKFVPNKTHYCRFAGITTTTYNSYLKSSDERLQNVMMMIDDYMIDANLTASQNKEVDNVTTIFRAKVEQNKQEQPTQQTVILADNVDVSSIKNRIKRLSSIKESASEKNE